MPSIDLNSDLGESFGRWTLGQDAALMESISSCNIACGFHAGDPDVMRKTVRLAKEHGLAIGAHPGLPDLVGFGRRTMSVTPDEVEALVLYQVGALAAIARAEGTTLRHVKAHGALYNMAIRDRPLADAIARAVSAFDPSLMLFGLPGTELLNAGEAAGLAVAAEGFADRAYEPDGSLTPRSLPDAVIHNPDEVVARAVRMALEGSVIARNGEEIPMRVATICTHGDTPGSHLLTRRLHEGLSRHGIKVRAVSGD
jgi:UPF0271 protein